MSRQTEKPNWFKLLEQDEQIVKLGQELEARMKVEPVEIDTSYEYSDCIATWNKGEALRKAALQRK